ncbi:MAG: tetratricopeptide repeat protein [Bacteroidales bacterium]|nr:tetratricopeptide repeat protein [Alloprevotella sp.]MBR1643982.1 tetratricopeptide repeat protein [Bacteroidales bacterium]
MAQKKQNTQLDVNETLSRSEAFITKNKKQLIICTVALLVIVGGFFGIKYGYLQPREEKAQTLLSLGQDYMLQGEYDKALKGEGKFPGFLKIAEDYSFTDAANLAKLSAGEAYAQKGDYKNAIKYLEDFSTKGDQTVSPTAIAALANCYAADKQVDKAIEKFKEAAKKADNESLSPLFLLEAGKLLETQKKNEEALAIYKQIKADYPTSALSRPQPTATGAVADAEIERYIERVSK